MPHETPVLSLLTGHGPDLAEKMEQRVARIVETLLSDDAAAVLRGAAALWTACEYSEDGP